MGNEPDPIIEKIVRPVGKKVTFTFPLKEGDRCGILIERVVIPSNPGSNRVLYWDTDPMSVWKRLLIQTSREKRWFRELLESVMEELHDTLG